MQQHRIESPFIPLFPEVAEALRDESPLCFKAYFLMLNDFFLSMLIELDWNSDAVWVIGRIRTSKREIAKRLGIDRRHLNEAIWPVWEKKGLVAISDDDPGIVLIPKFYKKGAASIDLARFQEIGLKTDQNQEQIQGMVREIDQIRHIIMEGWRGGPPKVEGSPLQKGGPNPATFRFRHPFKGF